MAEITLMAEPGRPLGSAASRRLRASGRVPAVVYGHGRPGTAVSVDARELRHALSGDAGLNQLLSLAVGPETHLALARSLQRHPVRHTVVHVDFLIVRRDEVIAADVPIVLVGEAKAVDQEQGIVEQPLTSLAVHATPDRIPSNLEVDISGLAVGDTIRVGDLNLPSGRYRGRERGRAGGPGHDQPGSHRARAGRGRRSRSRGRGRDRRGSSRSRRRSPGGWCWVRPGRRRRVLARGGLAARAIPDSPRRIRAAPGHARGPSRRRPRQSRVPSLPAPGTTPGPTP